MLFDLTPPRGGGSPQRTSHDKVTKSTRARVRDRIIIIAAAAGLHRLAQGSQTLPANLGLGTASKIGIAPLRVSNGPPLPLCLRLEDQLRDTLRSDRQPFSSRAASRLVPLRSSMAASAIAHMSLTTSCVVEPGSSAEKGRKTLVVFGLRTYGSTKKTLVVLSIDVEYLAVFASCPRLAASCGTADALPYKVSLAEMVLSISSALLPEMCGAPCTHRSIVSPSRGQSLRSQSVMQPSYLQGSSQLRMNDRLVVVVAVRVRGQGVRPRPKAGARPRL